jgi:hypothetical protein
MNVRAIAGILTIEIPIVSATQDGVERTADYYLQLIMGGSSGGLPPGTVHSLFTQPMRATTGGDA